MGRDGLVSDAKQQRLYEYVKRGSGVEPQGGRCPTAGTGSGRVLAESLPASPGLRREGPRANFGAP